MNIKNSSGQDISTAPLVSSSYGFTAREHDQESGLIYNRARYYMPEIGRFMQEDPDHGKVGLPASVVNKYIYVYNNPLKWTDPEGKFGILVAMLIAGVINGAMTHHRGGSFLEGFAIGAVGTLAVAGGAALAVWISGAAVGTGTAVAAGAIGGAVTNIAIASAMGVTGPGLILAGLTGGLGGAAIGQWGFSWLPGKSAAENVANGANDFNRGVTGSLPEGPTPPAPSHTDGAIVPYDGPIPWEQPGITVPMLP